MQTLGQAIFDGLFRSSGVSVLAAITTLIICMVSYSAWITPQTIIRLAPRLAAQSNDQSVRLTKNILTLQQYEHTSSPSIFLVGDSTLDKGLDLDKLPKYLESSDKPTKIVNLISGGQSILEAMAAIDNLPDSAQGTIVLGHSLRKLHLTRKNIGIAKNGSRRGYTSDAVGNFLKKHGHTPQSRHGIYSLDTFWFAAPRLADYYFRQLGSITKEETSTLEPIDVMSPEELRRSEQFYMTTVDHNFERYINGLGTGRDALLEIQNLIARRDNLHLLLIETPLNPSIVENQLGSRYYQQYLSNIQAFSDQHNIDYHNAAAQADLSTSDFSDVLHLAESTAINRFTNTVASIIARSQNE